MFLPLNIHDIEIVSCNYFEILEYKNDIKITLFLQQKCLYPVICTAKTVRYIATTALKVWHLCASERRVRKYSLFDKCILTNGSVRIRCMVSLLL